MVFDTLCSSTTYYFILSFSPDPATTTSSFTITKYTADPGLPQGDSVLVEAIMTVAAGTSVNLTTASLDTSQDISGLDCSTCDSHFSTHRGTVLASGAILTYDIIVTCKGGPPSVVTINNFSVS